MPEMRRGPAGHHPGARPYTARPTHGAQTKKPRRAPPPVAAKAWFLAQAAAASKTAPTKEASGSPRAAIGVVLAGLVLAAWLGGFAEMGVRAAGAGIAAWSKDLGFAVRHVEVRGLAHADEERLRALVDVAPGAGVFGVDPAEIRARILQAGWVQDATVMRMLPDRLVVVVAEHRPVARWRGPDATHVIDAEGRPIPGAAAAEFRDLPLVIGPGAAEEAARLVADLRAADALSARAVMFERVDARRWDAVLGNQARVMLPEARAGEALARLSALHAEAAVLDAPLARIDLRGPDIVLRARAPLSGTTRRDRRA